MSSLFLVISGSFSFEIMVRLLYPSRIQFLAIGRDIVLTRTWMYDVYVV